MNVPNRETRNNHRWWPAAVIIAAACAFCWPVFAGRIMLPADMSLLMLPWRELQDQFGFTRPHNPMLDPIQQYLPWRIYAVESLRGGFIPLWNPYAFCGTPFLANLQSTLLYPLNALFLLTGARHGFGLSAILHLSLGGLFMFAFLRTLSLRPAAALFGALVLMFNGFTVAWLEYPTLSLWVFMWLPALLWCCEKSLRHPRSMWPVLTALVVGVQFLGGHLQMSAYVVIAFLLYALVRIIAPAESNRRGWAIALPLLALALGLALAAAQILPTLELARHSGRVSHAAGAATSTAFPLTHFILYLAPNFFGNPADYNYWGSYRQPGILNFMETACYVGILPLFLAALSFSAKRTWRHWYFLALTIFALLVAIGSPLYLLLYWLAPGFRELAGLGRVLCLAGFGLAGLAAIGLDDLMGAEKARRTRWVIIGAAAAALLVAAAAVAFGPFRAQLPASIGFDAYLLRQIAFALGLLAAAAVLLALRLRLRVGGPAFAVLVTAVLFVDLFAHGIAFNPFVDARMAYPETDTTRWLQEHADHQRVASLASDHLDWMAHNSPMVFGLRDIHGSDSLRLRRSFELVSGPELDQAHYPPPDSPLLEALAVRYLMTREEVGEEWHLAWGGSAPVYENAEALPRAYVVSDFRVGPDEDFVDLLAGGSPGLRRVALVASGGPSLPAPRMGAPPPDATARFITDAPDEVVIEAMLQEPGLLVLTDSYYPGWKARVYETEVPIARANYGFRAVALPPGKHVVTFSYEPATFRLGLFISLAAFALLAAWGMAIYLGSPDSAAATARRS